MRAITQIAPLVDTVGLYGKFEVAIQIDADFNNPYDPTDIRLDGRFTAPSGQTVTVPGFYYQDFEEGANGRLTPTGDWSWRVRFTPTETGEWHYRILATTLSGTVRSADNVFTVTESDSPGFVRVDPRNSRYFVFDDGTPYFPVGENIGWGGGDPVGDYTRWFDALHAANGNFARVWMAPWGFSVEWLDTGLGNYDRRQGQAYQLDRVFDLAAERDIYIMLSLLNHGQFSETTNPQWNENPYNAANGGPLQSPGEFATNSEALRLWNQRLRYIAARWGYSPNIMAWEWWNEIIWTPLAQTDLLVPWIERSAAYLRSLDPYHHLITHSGSILSDSAVWSLDSLSFTQDHKYGLDNLPLTFSQLIPKWLAQYPDKPFLMGEFGLGSPLDIDTWGVEVHLGLWSAPMSGAAGTAMTWWWDNYVDPLDLYYHFAGVAAFFQGEDMAARHWQPVTAEFAERTKAKAYGLHSGDYALVWVVSRDYTVQYVRSEYTRILRQATQAGQENPDVVIEFPMVENAALLVSGFQPGTYQVELWDTMTGAVIRTAAVESTDGTVEIALPSFNADLAIKIKP